MPGQRKRREQQQAEQRRRAARTAPDAGHWELVLWTADRAELRTQVSRLGAAGVDPESLWIDAPCSRDASPPVYRLSRFVSDPGSGDTAAGSDG
ncbi:hypothetical protein ACFW1A_05010 [Kitasatospora sp. NPDC058965]|uniref:hypothetical protein n=1 Tax=Kitasatospora sp. NPDC058965 TaxID=3346682 RepID=UPI0036A1B75F